MAELVDPLQSSQPMVDEEGRPTEYFLQQWQALIENVQAITDAQSTADGADNTATAAQSTADAVQAITLTAGTGLNGGGDLSDDRTFNLEDTAVTQGTFGSTTKVSKVTVDQQGRITAAEEVTIVGGGGGGNWEGNTRVYDDGNSSGSLFAFKGGSYTVQEDFTITNVYSRFSGVLGATYAAAIAVVDGSDVITSIVTSPTVQVNRTSRYQVAFVLTKDLKAGERVAILVGRTDAGNTHAFTTQFNIAPTNSEFFMFPLTSPVTARIAQTAPAVGQTVDNAGGATAVTPLVLAGTYP